MLNNLVRDNWKVIIITFLVCCICGFMTIHAGEMVLLYDDFADGFLTNQPEGVNNPIWTSHSWGLPKPVDDGTGNKVLRIPRVYMSAGSLEWTDYQVEMKFRLLPNTGNNFYRIQLMPRFGTGSNHRFAYQWSPTRGFQFHIYEGSTKKFEVKYPDVTPLEAWGTSWHTLALRMVGDCLTVYFDGEIVANITLPSFPPNGNIMLYTDRRPDASLDPSIEIDHIKVTEVLPSQLIDKDATNTSKPK